MRRVLGLLLVLFAVPAGAQAPASDPAARSKLVKRLAGLIEDTKLQYRKVQDGVWVLPFEGQHLDPVDVLVQVRADMIVVFAVAREKAVPSSDQMRKLLEASYNSDFSKVGIDPDGDLMALTELPGDANVSALKTAIDEVAALADTIAGLTTGAAAAPAVVTETFEEVAPGTGATMPLVRGSFELAYDPQKWKAQATTEPNTTQLSHTSGDAWVKVIAERLQVAPEGLREIALTNAKELAPTLVSETWRTSNGLKVLVLRYEGVRSGIKFTFYNQMYSDSSGLVQIAAWMATNLFEEHKRDLHQLFAGFRKVRE